MAAAFTKNVFYTALEFIKHIHRDKGLQSAGKAAAMDTAGSTAAKKLVADGDGKRKLLMGGITGGDHILKVHP